MDIYLGLVTVYLTFSLPFAIWLLITYFEELPRELEEAVAVDGASRFTAFWRIVLPQAGGGVAVTAVFSFINAWNEFLLRSCLPAETAIRAPDTRLSSGRPCPPFPRSVAACSVGSPERS
jgi:ABC-type glycerol-3-phosphate transport system permease component